MKKIWTIMLGGLYVVSPIDILPDPIPVLGWLDDIGVIAFIIKTLTAAEEKVKEIAGRCVVIDGIPID